MGISEWRRGGFSFPRSEKEKGYRFVPLNQMQICLHLVTLYANILAYGTPNLLGSIVGIGLGTEIRHLALGRSPGREDFSLPEPSSN